MKQSISAKTKGVLKSIGWIALYAALQLIVMVIFFLICINGKGLTDQKAISDWVTNNTFLMTITASVLFIVIALLSCRANKVSPKEKWKVRKLKPQSYVMPCIITLAYSLFYALAAYDAAGGGGSMALEATEFYGTCGVPIAVLALLVAAPIAEELLYRGIIMNRLKGAFSVKAAMLFSSVFFGMMHLPAGGLSLAAGAVGMGAILAFIYEKTGSLCVAVVAHAIANLPDFLLSGSPVVSNTVRIALAILFLAISLVSLVLWWKITAK